MDRLTRELEKKFSDRHVVFVAQRRMLRKPTRTSRVQQKRPRSRTLTNVHEKILEDLVFPTEIVGKRTRVAVDGSKLLKVYVFNFSSLCLYHSVQPILRHSISSLVVTLYLCCFPVLGCPGRKLTPPRAVRNVRSSSFLLLPL